jgi:hypothetical protein
MNGNHLTPGVSHGGADSFRTSATYALSLESYQSSLDQLDVISWGSSGLGLARLGEFLLR